MYSLMDNIKKLLIDSLIERGAIRKRYKKDWFTMRCPFCGDSERNPKSQHLNIRISDEDNFMFLNCFRAQCDVSSMMRREHLMVMGITDIRILDFVSNSNNYPSKFKEAMTIENKYKYPHIIDKTTLDYYKMRTKQYLDVDTIDNLRIVTDLGVFFELNKLAPKRNIKPVIDEEKRGSKFIGFVNESGSFMTIRRITEDGDRHIKYELELLPFGIRHKPYTINNKFDIKKEPYIFIQEGIFDTLNAYYTVAKGVPGLYIASGGKQSILGIFKYLSKYYYNVHWVFGKDSDVPLSFFEDMKKHFGYRFKNKMSVIYNENGKDYGVMDETVLMKKIEI
jgi:hypothetical protein